MAVYRVTQPQQSWYGESIGILILDAHYPCVPGNVGNATTFPFPVRYKKVIGASIDRLLNRRDTSLVTPFIDAAQELAEEGVRAVTGACGFMALFQREVADAVPVPVFLSSLMQIPFIRDMLGAKRRIGVIAADRSALTPAHFAGAGVADAERLVIAGMEGQTEFREAVLEERGTLDSGKIEAEVVAVARNLVATHADLGALLLECSDLPPYAAAVQSATGLPVFDFTTMIRFVHSALVRTPFHGFL